MRSKKKRKAMKHTAEQKPKIAMRTISAVVLPEEVELAGDVDAEPVGREELPMVPTTSVVLVGVVPGDRVALLESNVVLVGVV